MANLPADKSRPTTRLVAERAGVSSAAVSLALRNHPKISLKTREHVQRVAAALGYRPDPHVAKLMHHLRTRREPGFQSTICALTTIPAERELAYVRDILESARQRAESLGHGFMVLHIDDAVERRPDLQRIFRSRGVEGLLLPPMARARQFTELLDWKNFSVVTATNGVLAPEFHRVVPHQFSNMLVLCEQLARRNYRRIGIVQPSAQDLSVNHGFSAAVVWQNLLGGTELVMPLIFDGDKPLDLVSWFKREKPDAIIVTGDDAGKAVARELGLRIPGPVGFASANKAGTSIFAGMEERPAEIGATAIGLLASMIQRGERGVPAVPTVTMIKGRWIEGRSVRSLSRKPHVPTAL
jgi:DNA-binding LacI/PurR family transcriptional regulator